MARKKDIDNPFLRAMPDYSSGAKDMETPAMTETDYASSRVVLQINPALIDELESIIDDLLMTIPAELQTDFTVETINELIIAYCLSDFRAHNDGSSLAERLTNGWTQVISQAKAGAD